MATRYTIFDLADEVSSILQASLIISARFMEPAERARFRRQTRGVLRRLWAKARRDGIPEQEIDIQAAHARGFVARL